MQTRKTKKRKRNNVNSVFGSVGLFLKNPYPYELVEGYEESETDYSNIAEEKIG